MSDNKEQTNAQYVTEAVFITMDNDNYHYDKIDTCHRRSLRRQHTSAKYYIYAETVNAGKQHAKQLSDGSLNLRHFSPKLMQVHLNDSYQIFLDTQNHLADIIETFLPSATIIQFLRLKTRLTLAKLLYQLELTMEVLNNYRLDYRFSCVDFANISKAIQSLWLWKQHTKLMLQSVE